MDCFSLTFYCANNNRRNVCRQGRLSQFDGQTSDAGARQLSVAKGEPNPCGGAIKAEVVELFIGCSDGRDQGVL